MERVYKSEEYSSQISAKELIEWVNSGNRETIVLDGLYSSAKAFAIAASATKGVHIVLLNNREDAAYCSADLNNLSGREDVFFFPSSLNHSSKGIKKDLSFQVQRTAAIQALNQYKRGDYKGSKLIIAAYPHSVAELIPDNKR